MHFMKKTTKERRTKEGCGADGGDDEGGGSRALLHQQDWIRIVGGVVVTVTFNGHSPAALGGHGGSARDATAKPVVRVVKSPASAEYVGPASVVERRLDAFEKLGGGDLPVGRDGPEGHRECADLDLTIDASEVAILGQVWSTSAPNATHSNHARRDHRACAVALRRGPAILTRRPDILVVTKSTAANGSTSSSSNAGGAGTILTV